MSEFDNNDYISAHKFSSHHKRQLKESDVCGCFYCLRIFKPGEIFFWLEGEDTALCPYCGIDSVIGSKSGYPITEEFLKKMRDYWF